MRKKHKEETDACPRCSQEVPISQLKLCTDANLFPEFENKNICCGDLEEEWKELEENQ
jgi:hypothetical protein